MHSLCTQKYKHINLSSRYYIVYFAESANNKHILGRTHLSILACLIFGAIHHISVIFGTENSTLKIVRFVLRQRNTIFLAFLNNKCSHSTENWYMK